MNTSMVTQPVLTKIETGLVASIKIYFMFLLELPDQVFDAVFKSELYSVIMPSFRPYSSGIISCHSVTRPVTCCECFSLCFEAEHATLVSNLNEAFKKNYKSVNFNVTQPKSFRPSPPPFPSMINDLPLKSYNTN